MIIKKIKATALLCSLIASASLQAQQAQHFEKHDFSIQQCVEYAGKNNTTVKNALLDYKIQEQTNKSITAAAYPQVKATAGTTYFPDVPVQVFPNFISAGTYGVLVHEGVKDGNGNPIQAPTDYGYIQAAFGSKWNASVGLSVSQILFDGQVFVGLQARRVSLDYAMKSVEVTTENIKVNIYKIYYQLVVSKTQMQQLDANIARLEKLQHDTRELFINGFAEKMDVDRTTVQLSNLQTQKITTQRTIDNGYIGLKVLMGMPVGDSLTLTDAITEDKLKTGMLDVNVKNYQYSDRKEYQYLDAATKLNEYNVKRYKYMYLPTASLSSAYSKNAYRDQFDIFGKGDWYSSWNVGLNISVPLFLGFQRDASLKTAQLQWEQTKNRMQDLKLTIDSEVEQAQNKFKAAILALDNQKQNMELAESVYNQSKKKYEVGTGSTTDITNAQTDLINAQTNYINAMYDAVIARIDYQKAIGALK